MLEVEGKALIFDKEPDAEFQAIGQGQSHSKTLLTPFAIGKAEAAEHLYIVADEAVVDALDISGELVPADGELFREELDVIPLAVDVLDDVPCGTHQLGDEGELCGGALKKALKTLGSFKLLGPVDGFKHVLSLVVFSTGETRSGNPTATTTAFAFRPS